MKNVVIGSLAAGLLCLGVLGCADKKTTESETKITTPGGETTVKIERDVKKTGENPPPAKP
jgi:hypothetical protein